VSLTTLSVLVPLVAMMMTNVLASLFVGSTVVAGGHGETESLIQVISQRGRLDADLSDPAFQDTILEMNPGEVVPFNLGNSSQAVEVSGEVHAAMLIQEAYLSIQSVAGEAVSSTNKSEGTFVENVRHAVMGSVAIAVLSYAMYSPSAPVVVIVAGWACASISMSLLNKQATIVFPVAALLVSLQMGITDIVLLATEHKNMTYGKSSDLWKWCVVPFFYASVLASGIWALKVTTVSTVLVLRNVLPLFTLVAEKLLMTKSAPVTLDVVLSMIVVVLGSVLYAWQNVSVSRDAIGFIMLNCVLVVMDRLVQRSLLASPDFTVSPSLCMIINNTVGILIMVVLAFATSEIWQWPEALRNADASVWVWIVLTGINGCFLGYLGIRTQKNFSATSFLMLQNANKVFLILLSVAIFGDVLTSWPLVGCVLSMVGALWYGSLCLPSEAAVPKAAKA